MGRPAELALTPGYIAGRLHFYRDRGAGYVDGFRTSLQAAVIVAGVAFGANFTEKAEAMRLGACVLLGLETLKIVLGWIDNRFGVIRTQSVAASLHANPVMEWQLLLLEELAIRNGAPASWVEENRRRLQLDPRRRVVST